MKMTPTQHHLSLIEKITPSMRYDGKEPFTEWQGRARKRLAALLHMEVFEACDPTFTLEFTEEFEDFTEYRFTIQSEPGYFVPAHLWVPKGIEGKLPLCICLQGHSTGMHISLGRPKYEGDEALIGGGDRDFAKQIIKEGFCSLAIEQRNFGECGGTETGTGCQVPTLSALLFGRTVIGERVWDISRMIDAATANFDMIDSAKIYCMGNSGGGTATFYAACLDERISFAMPSCAVCTYKDSIAAMRHCTCNFIPGIANDFDMGDLAGLIAPRKLAVVHGVKDKIFPDHGVRKAYETIERMYAAAGAPENCRLVSGSEGHRFYAVRGWRAAHELLGE